MKETLVGALAESPVLTLFVVIGLGYLAGEIRILGFRFGVAGVLFVGLAVGSLSPEISLPEIVSTLGLIIFVYAVGIQAGPTFFASFQRKGWRDNALAVSALAFGALISLAVSYFTGLPAPRAAGLYCGALTNTPALAAARERVREDAQRRKLPAEAERRLADEPIIAYGIAYPIGVIGVLICFQILRRVWRVDLGKVEEPPEILVRDFAVRNPGVIGRTITEVLRRQRDPGFVISRIQKQGETSLAKDDTVLTADSIVAVVGDEDALARAEQIFGEAAPTRIELDRSELDYRRVFVSAKEVVGRRIADLDLPGRLDATITRLRRGDVDVVPAADTRLEFGDRVRVLTRRDNFARIASYFGDSIRGTAETDFGSVAIGMVLGALVGGFPIPMPGGPVRLGLAGGPLLAALILGKLERTGRITWTIPISANLTLRQIGLLLFLAGAGTRAGWSFASTFSESGWQMLAAGAGITFGVTLATMIAGYKLLAIPFDSLMGLVSGVQTQPACIAYASGLTRSDAPNAAYATVYPASMIAKIVLAQLLVAMAWRG